MHEDMHEDMHAVRKRRARTQKCASGMSLSDLGGEEEGQGENLVASSGFGRPEPACVLGVRRAASATTGDRDGNLGRWRRRWRRGAALTAAATAATFAAATAATCLLQATAPRLALPAPAACPNAKKRRRCGAARSGSARQRPSRACGSRSCQGRAPASSCPRARSRRRLRPGPARGWDAASSCAPSSFCAVRPRRRPRKCRREAAVDRRAAPPPFGEARSSGKRTEENPPPAV
eukprot:360147-Chlamydomonas_euryale.AAC.3